MNWSPGNDVPTDAEIEKRLATLDEHWPETADAVRSYIAALKRKITKPPAPRKK